MKKHKTLSLILSVMMLPILLFSVLSFGACGQNTDTVVITADFNEYDLQDKTLKDLMDILVENGELEFESANGMINSINKVSNTTNCFWMLYTDDTELSNEAWGTTEYNGKTYASAIYGYEQLPLKDGCTYIWVYEQF